MKRRSLKPLAVQYLLFTLILVILILLFNSIAGHLIYHGVWWILSFFIILSVVSVAIMKRAAVQSPRNFMNIYLATMVARLFVSIIFATFFILYDQGHVIEFAGNFIVLYLLYLGFEIYGILTNLRHHFKEGSDDHEG